MYVNLIGPDGSGKNTQIELLIPYFPHAILTREPGGTEEAEVIRDVILNKDYDNHCRLSKIVDLLHNENVNSQTKQLLKLALHRLEETGLDGLTETFLYAASRSESIEKVIQPNLQNGNPILGNRSVACSVAYQGNARDIGMEKVWNINEPIVGNHLPDLEIFIDVPVDVTMERLSNRSEKQDRLDLEDVTFHQKAREGYLHYYQYLCPYRVSIINGVGTIEEIHTRIINTLKSHQLITH